MQTSFLFFSKIFLSFDFFSRVPAFNTIIISSIFLSEIFSKILFILSVTLEIIIAFLFSNKDLFKISDNKISSF